MSGTGGSDAATGVEAHDAAGPGGSGARTGVVVVGAGPTGLLTAVALARRGVEVRVVDVRTAPDPTTRALSVWGRAAEILRQHGVDAADLRAASVPVRKLTYLDRGRHLATFRLPTGASCRTLPQQQTERLLADRLAALGVKVEWGRRFVGLVQDDEGVCVSVEREGTTERQTITAAYAVGADGASSTVRKALGIGFDGETIQSEFAVVDARITGHIPSDECFFYQDPTGPLVVVPMGDGVFRFLALAPPDGTNGMGRVVAARGPEGVTLSEVVSSALFRVHAREAARYRDGRTFLVGDAAHIHSPAGGQGMNNGLQDAHNLGWKLAAVLHGDAPARVLDTYEPERRAATRRIIRDTTAQTSIWMTTGKVRIAVRNLLFRLAAGTGAAARWYAPVMAGFRTRYPRRTPGAVRCRGQRAVGTLAPGVVRTDHWELRVGAWGNHVLGLRGQKAAVRVRVEPTTSSDLTCGGRGLTLVRPDGHIQWHGHIEHLAELERELGWWGLAS